MKLNTGSSTTFLVQMLAVFILLLACQDSFVLAQAKKNPNNGHWYSFFSGSYSTWTLAMTAINGQPAQETTKMPQLATINSKEEWDWIVANLVINTNFFISGIKDGSDGINFNSGRESSTQYYATGSGQSISFTNWGVNSPSLVTTDVYTLVAGATRLWQNTAYISGTNTFLIEWVPQSEVYVRPAITNGETFNLAPPLGTFFTGSTMTYKFIDSSSAAEIFTCSGVRMSAVTCAIPAGTGAITYDIIQTDGTNTNTIKYWRYQMPQIDMVYPGASGTVITLSGKNFGTGSDASLLNIKVAGAVCTSPSIIVPHIAAVCTVASDFTIPASISLGTVPPLISTMQTVYDKNSLTAFRVSTTHSATQQVNSATTTRWLNSYPVEGVTLRYLPIFTNLASYNNFRAVVPSTSVSTMWIALKSSSATQVAIDNQGGPNNGAQVFVSTGTTCSAMIYCPGTFPAFTAMNQYFYFATVNSAYFRETSTTARSVVGSYGVLPTISDTTVRYVNTTGGTVTQVVATTVGFIYTQVSATIDGVAITATKSRVPLAVYPVIPAGTGVNKKMKYIFEGSIQLNGGDVSYNRPFLDFITPSVIPTAGGRVTMNGFNFGTNTALVSVTVGGTDCGIVMCDAPAGSGTNKIVRVTVDSQLQPNTFTVNYAAPIVTTTSNTLNSLTVTGVNFGTVPSVVAVKLPNIAGITATSVTETSIIVTMPNVGVLNGNIQVTVSGQTSTAIPYQLVPQIVSQTVKPPTTGGMTTVKGLYLNQLNSAGQPTVTNLIVNGVTTPVNAYSVDSTNTYMSFMLPAGTGGSILCVFFIDSRSTSFTVAYQSPTITSITQNGQSFTVVGTGFGTDPTRIELYAPAYGGVSGAVMTVAQTEFTINVPAVAQNGGFFVSIDSVFSNPYNGLTLTPILYSADRPLAAGGALKIWGYYLQGSSPSPTITVNGLNCPLTAMGTDAPNATLTCAAPVGVGAITIVVTLAGKSAVITSSYASPIITGVTTTNTSISLVGKNFGNALAYILIPGLPFPGTFITIPKVPANDQSVIFDLKELPLNGPVTLSVSGQVSNPYKAVYRPNVLSMTEVPTVGGSSITIMGTALNTIDSTGAALTTSVTIEGVDCPITDTYYSTTNTFYVCTAPAGTGYKMATVFVDGQTAQFDYKYQSPIVTSIEQSSDGDCFYIRGSNFGPSSSLASVSLAGVTYSALATNDTTITITQDAATKNGAVFVTVDTLVSNTIYLSLTPSIVSVTSASTQGGSVTITGNFVQGVRSNGTSATTQISIGGNPAAFVNSFYNGTTVSYMVVTAPIGVGKDLPINVTIDNISSATVNLFAYSPPTVSSYYQGADNCVTVSGNNFGPDIESISFLVNGQSEPAVALVTPHIKASFLAVPSLKNGIVSIVAGGQEAIQSIPLLMTPVIASYIGLSLTGGSITILGQYLNNVDYLGAALDVGVTIGNLPCTNPTTTGTTLTCLAPGGLGGNVDIVVTIATKSATSAATFPAPVINTMSPTQNLADNSITLVGSNFGQDFNQIYINMPGSQTALSPNQFTNGDTLIVKIPSNAKSGDVSITVFGLVSNSMPLVISPVITTVADLQSFPTSVIMSGQFFLTTRANGTDTDVVLTYDSQIISSDKYNVGSNMVIVEMPGGTGTNHSFVLTIDGQSSTFYVDYPVPELYAAEQDISSTFHFTRSLELTGASFGFVKSDVQVILKNQPSVVIPIDTMNNETIFATLPSFALNDIALVNVSGQLSNQTIFEFGPILRSITSADAEGGEIKIGGHYLNTVNATGSAITITVMFPGNTPCTNVVKIADDLDMSYITCMAPPGTGITNNVKVTVGDMSDNINFAYGAPVISSVIVTDSNTVSIIGKNFGTVQSGVSVYVGANTQTFTFVNSTFLTFNADEQNKNGPITVKLIDGRISNPVEMHLTPLITSVTKPIKTTGDLLTIVGSFLNPTRLDGSSTNVTVVIVDLNQQCTNAVATGSSITFYIDQKASPSTVQFSYIAPLISSVVQQGSSDDLVTINNQIIATTLVNPATLFAKLTGPSKNGDIIVNVDGQDSNTQPLSIKASVTSITSTSPYGGVVELVGKYLWTTRLVSTPTTISIQIGGVECTSPVANGSDGTKLKCTLGDASQFESDIELSIDSVGANAIATYTSNPPVLTSISSSYYLVSSVVTIVGNEFYSPSSVTIGGSQCGGVVVVDAQHITCTFDSKVGNNATSTLDVTIESGNSDEITFAGVFKYTLLQCLNSCSSHGTCVSSGQCQCNNGYSGADCSITYSQSLVSGDSGSVSGGKFTMFNNSMEFLLSHIQEVRQDNTIVQTIPLTKWDVYDEYGNTTVYNSTSTTHNIELYVTKHSTASVQSFLGDDLVIPSNSIKHFMTIDRFTFESINSSLRIIYQFKSPSQIEYNCDNETTKYQYDTSSSTTTIKSYTIDTPVGTMMASFSNRANIDDTNAIVTSIQAITSVDSTTQSTAGVQYIAIQVPSFGDFVEIDPIFSATSKTAPSTDACVISSSSITTPILLLSIVVSIISLVF
ncbi:hypothetical protein DFA_07401 [Cavenderia fasciculata]|uniref:EGF-like domain-containing protein n=1 Tax=Cavenderia fasciculata TaxID=261658 RepID=F4PWB4_CACFS|nr:uncharacterized protein DFA_07401 [Cavenderia fasciculata]EGG20278.1 hypothetical protein DFA_07401 [Cavenderia fasciculata]|eukprot:XP_004367261.1 hypothetical protein DFA_07401 [Cavenderia fasciculata]